MALSDPELELLRDLLVDDPGAEPWFQVGEELIRRGEWLEAEIVISGGLSVHTERMEAWPLLARASLELGHVGLALAALDNVDFDPDGAPEAARVRILALERAGRTEDLRLCMDAFLSVDPDDVVVTSVQERLTGAAEVVQSADVVPGRIPDPMISMDRADRYIAVGRPDRAMRVYRRILFHDPGNAGARAGLKGLGAFSRQMTEDLSEELLHPASAPPALDMPAPKLQSMIADEEVTEANPNVSEVLAQYARGMGKKPKSSLPPSFDEDDDELTDPFSAIAGLDGKLSTKARAPRRRRRRRSLLNR